MATQHPDAAQIRAALALLRWENEDLARACGVTPQSISNIKRGVTRPQPRVLMSIRRVLEFSGIEFLEKSGVQFRSNDFKIYDGPDQFDEFYDFLFHHLQRHGGEVCVSVSDERLLTKYRKDPAIHYRRMQDLTDRNVVKSFRILSNHEQLVSGYSYSVFKWQPESGIAPTAFYAFGECLALISFVHETPPYVVVLHSAPLAQSYRQAFDIAWAAAKEHSPLQEGVWTPGL
jgi:transcriptional regulator with XRE-family HTH domain